MEKVPPITEPVANDDGAGDASASAPIFSHLIASKPSRDLASTARSSLGSLIIHAVVVTALVIATMSVGEEVLGPEQFKMIELPPEPPPPPPAVVKVNTPQIEAPKGFQTLSVPDIVPPDIPPPQANFVIREADFTGMGVEGGVAKSDEQKTQEQIALAPTFTPYTLGPELTNREAITALLVRNYPPLLRDAGIGGKVLVWVFINDKGEVQNTRVKEGSGYDALDQAALAVAASMKFRPAMNRDKHVPVWVEIPVVFTAN
jgi:TonB family protein